MSNSQGATPYNQNINLNINYNFYNNLSIKKHITESDTKESIRQTEN